MNDLVIRVIWLPFICVTWLSHTTQMNESCHTYPVTHSYVFDSFIRVINELFIVMSHIWMSHVTQMNESCHTYPVTHMNDLFIRVIWLPFICVTWLIHTCDMTLSYVWYCSFVYVAWFIHMCDMTHSYVWYGVATISRLLKIIGLFWRIWSLL